MSDHTRTILVVEDEPLLRCSIANALEAGGHRVIEAGTALGATDIAQCMHLDVIVLDLGLPDEEGIDVCRTVRASSDASIIVVSGRTAEHEKIGLFEAGADDYITKPFGIGELQARVAVQLRRAKRHAARSSQPVIEHAGVRIDFLDRRAWRDGVEVRLTNIEWKLLGVLARERGQVLTHRAIYDAVWHARASRPQTHLRVHITHLRRKLERVPASPELILTEPGVGYRLHWGGEEA